MFWDEAKKLGVLGYVISKDDVIIESNEIEPEIRRNVYSVSKSFTSVAMALAEQEGLLSLDEKLTDVFAEDLPETVSENLKKATVRDLLTMCLGHSDSHLMGSQRVGYTDDNWVRMSLAIPFDHEPGSHFVYSNVGPYLAAVLLQKRAGCSLVDYLMPRLFQPLGIWRPSWETDPQGRSFGASGLMLAMSELHKFGLLCLHNGNLNGRLLIPEKWIDECRKPQGAADNYSYLFWLGKENSFRADGMYGQYSIIIPEKNAVVTMVSECRNTDALWDLIYNELFPNI